MPSKNRKSSHKSGKFDSIKRSGSRIHYSRSSSGCRMPHASCSHVVLPYDTHPKVVNIWQVYTVCTHCVHTVHTSTNMEAYHEAYEFSVTSPAVTSRTSPASRVQLFEIRRFFYGPVSRFADNSGIATVRMYWPQNKNIF